MQGIKNAECLEDQIQNLHIERDNLLEWLETETDEREKSLIDTRILDIDFNIDELCKVL